MKTFQLTFSYELLIPKRDKNTSKKEHYKPILLMNRDAKFVSKISANQIQPVH